MKKTERRCPARSNAALTKPLWELSDMARRKKADAPPLTQARLQEVFHYDPGTGLFWRYRKAGRADITRPAGDRNSDGYVFIGVDSVRYLAHRAAWLYVYGTWPKERLDHINGIRDDNRLTNLREATNTENCRNGGLPKHNTSGFKGAIKFRKGWLARIKFNRKIINLGYFKTPEQAHDAYCKAARQLHGEFWNPGTKNSRARSEAEKV